MPSSNIFHKPKISYTSLTPGIALIIIYLLLFSFQIFKFTHSKLETHVLGTSSELNTAQITALINLERSKHQLSPLIPDPQLEQAASLKLNHMIENNYFAHKTQNSNPWKFINQTDYHYLHAGENLARDYQNSTYLVQAWMDSPAHKDNILNPNYTHTGVAIDPRQEQYLVVQMFASPLPQNNQTLSIHQHINLSISKLFTKPLSLGVQFILLFLISFITLMFIYRFIHRKKHSHTKISDSHWRR